MVETWADKKYYVIVQGTSFSLIWNVPSWTRPKKSTLLQIRKHARLRKNDAFVHKCRPGDNRGSTSTMTHVHMTDVRHTTNSVTFQAVLFTGCYFFTGRWTEKSRVAQTLSIKRVNTVSAIIMLVVGLNIIPYKVNLTHKQRWHLYIQMMAMLSRVLLLPYYSSCQTAKAFILCTHDPGFCRSEGQSAAVRWHKNVAHPSCVEAGWRTQPGALCNNTITPLPSPIFKQKKTKKKRYTAINNDCVRLTWSDSVHPKIEGAS